MDNLTFSISEFTGSDAEVQFLLEELDGDIQITASVVNPLGDIRGLFFNVGDDFLNSDDDDDDDDEDDDGDDDDNGGDDSDDDNFSSVLQGLVIEGDDVTDIEIDAEGGVRNLGNGANINPLSFEVGVEIGTPGIGKDDIGETTFVLSHPDVDLTLDLFLQEDFGARLTSVGSGNREGSSKLSGIAPEDEETEVTLPPFADFEFFRITYTTELILFFNVDSIEQITNEQIFEYLANLDIGFNASQFADYQFFISIYEERLLAEFEVNSLSEISFEDTYNFLLSVGLEDGVTLSQYIDLEYYRSTFTTELISFYSVTSIEEVSLTQTLEYILSVGFENGFDPSPFVNLEYYRETFSEEILEFFEVESIETVSFAQIFEFLTTVGIESGFDTSAFIDIDYYRETFAEQLIAFFSVESVEEVSISNIYQFLVSEGIEQGFETSRVIDFNFYRNRFSTELLEFFEVDSLTEVSISQTYEYITTVGLEEGFSPSLQVDFDFYRSVYAEQLISFYGVQSISEVTSTQILEFAVNRSSELPEIVQTPGNLFVLGGQELGSTVNLEIEVTSTSNSILGEIGVFAVDDENGGIDLDDDGVIDITPNSANYVQQALSNGQVIFSVLPDSQSLGLTNLERLVTNFSSGDSLVFYLVEESTTDAVITGQTELTNVTLGSTFTSETFEELQVTSLSEENFSLNWTSLGLEFEVQETEQTTPLGTALQGLAQRELIDLRSVTQQVEFDLSVVNSSASFNNFVGFYEVENEEGAVRDPLTDQLLNPGDAGYAAAAVRLSQSEQRGFSFNKNSAGQDLLRSGGSIFAPFIIANGSPEEFLAENPDNQLRDDLVSYFSYISANPDNADHIRLLGDNTFGFEDLRGGGDQDFNDLVVKFELALA